MAKMIYGVTTYNRLSYLQENLAGWQATRDRAHQWSLVICDDGSTDGTVEFLRQLTIEGVPIHLHFNQRRGVGVQTNQILRDCAEWEFDLGFKSDDDLLFTAPGWDNLYYDAVKRSGYDHLCFFDVEWARRFRRQQKLRWWPAVSRRRGIRSDVGAVGGAMGAFWTFTPRVIEKVGYFDTGDGWLWGREHTDFSARCCRAGFNRRNPFYDALGSERYIKLMQEDYAPAITREEIGVAENLGPGEEVRWARIGDPGRVFVPYNESPVNMRGERILP